MDQNQILIRPIVTEKSLNQASQGWYTFAVALLARKPAIKKAIESTFKVEVLALKTMRVKGKNTRRGKKQIEVKKSDWKKAIAKLASGQKIDLFEVPGGTEAGVSPVLKAAAEKTKGEEK